MQITPSLSIPEDELRFEFLRASGPGGQNVNKVATAVQLRFDLRNTSALTDEVKARLIHLAGSRMTSDGILVIEAKRYRSQERNRSDAIERFQTLIKKSLIRPRKRRHTLPTAASKERRVELKKRRGEIKRLRKPVDE